MTEKTMLRVATLNTAHAIDVACSDMESAVGLRVRAEFQEIEGCNLTVELRLGDDAEPPSPFTPGLRHRCCFHHRSAQFLD